MNKTINDCLAKFMSYSEVYCNLDKSTFRTTAKEQGVKLDLLEMVIFLELPENKDMLTLGKIRERLLERHVVYCDENKDIVFIGEYSRQRDSGFENNFYIWSLFHYTYEMQEKTDNERNEFLWASIICPYIYKLSKFQEVSEAYIKSLLHKYSVYAYMNENNKSVLEGKDKDTKNYFKNLINSVCGVNKIFPKRGEKDTAIEEAVCGIKVIRTVLHKGKIK